MTYSITPRFTHHYADTIIAHTPDNVWIIPNVKRLTDDKRLEIGRLIFDHDGRDQVWDNAGDSERLRWTRTHMGRYGKVSYESYLLSNDDVPGDIKIQGDVTHDSGAMNGYPVENIHVIKL